MGENKSVAHSRKAVMIRMTVALAALSALISIPFVLLSDWLNGWCKVPYALAAAAMFGLYLARSYIRRLLGLFSRAGAVRLIQYDLLIDRVVVPRDACREQAVPDFKPEMFEGKNIRGVKRLTYGRCASPFTQLMSMSLKEFPGMCNFIGRKSPELELNKRYLARRGVPLLRVVGQQDGFAALARHAVVRPLRDPGRAAGPCAELSQARRTFRPSTPAPARGSAGACRSPKSTG